MNEQRVETDEEAITKESEAALRKHCGLDNSYLKLTTLAITCDSMYQ